MSSRSASESVAHFSLRGALALTLGVLANAAAQDPAIEPVRAASVNPYGVNGMSQVISAENLGAGRLNV